MNKITDQMDLKDIYRTLCQIRKKYTFFSTTHETFSKLEHICWPTKQVLRNLKYWNDIYCLFQPKWYETRNQLQMENWRSPKVWKLNITLEPPTEQRRNKRETRKYLAINKNKNMPTHMVCSKSNSKMLIYRYKCLYWKKKDLKWTT